MSKSRNLEIENEAVSIGDFYRSMKKGKLKSQLSKLLKNKEKIENFQIENVRLSVDENGKIKLIPEFNFSPQNSKSAKEPKVKCLYKNEYNEVPVENEYENVPIEYSPPVPSRNESLAPSGRSRKNQSFKKRRKSGPRIDENGEIIIDKSEFPHPPAAPPRTSSMKRSHVYHKHYREPFEAVKDRIQKLEKKKFGKWANMASRFKVPATIFQPKNWIGLERPGHDRQADNDHHDLAYNDRKSIFNRYTKAKTSGQWPKWARYKFEKPFKSIDTFYKPPRKSPYGYNWECRNNPGKRYLTPKQEVQILDDELEGNVEFLAHKMRYLGKKEKGRVDFDNEALFSHPQIESTYPQALSFLV